MGGGRGWTANGPIVVAMQSLPAVGRVGRIDVHSHLIPGVDDGCVDFAQVLECVRVLRAEGYVGTVCTPHVYGPAFLKSTPDRIRKWTAELSARLADAGV